MLTFRPIFQRRKWPGEAVFHLPIPPLTSPPGMMTMLPRTGARRSMASDSVPARTLCVILVSSHSPRSSYWAPSLLPPWCMELCNWPLWDNYKAALTKHQILIPLGLASSLIGHYFLETLIVYRSDSLFKKDGNCVLLYILLISNVWSSEIYTEMIEDNG